MNVIAWPEFKLAYYDVAVQYVSYNTTGIPTNKQTKKKKRKNIMDILKLNN